MWLPGGSADLQMTRLHCAVKRLHSSSVTSLCCLCRVLLKSTCGTTAQRAEGALNTHGHRSWDEYDPVASESCREQAFKDLLKSNLGGPAFRWSFLFHERRNAKRPALTTLCGWIKGSREETARWKDCEGFAENYFMLAEDVFSFETDTNTYCALLWAGRMVASSWRQLLVLTLPKKTLTHFQTFWSINMFCYHCILRSKTHFKALMFPKNFSEQTLLNVSQASSEMHYYRWPTLIKI